MPVQLPSDDDSSARQYLKPADLEPSRRYIDEPLPTARVLITNAPSRPAVSPIARAGAAVDAKSPAQ